MEEIIEEKTMLITNILQDKSKNEEPSDDLGFIEVKKRKKSPFIKGTRVSNPFDGLKCAKSVFDIYVGRCDINVEESDIMKYIKSNLEIDIKSITKLKGRSMYSNSFKITLDSEYKDKLLNEEFWPSGIICRKFYNNRYNGYRE